MYEIAEAKKVRVLERAFDIIECFSERDPELTLVEISKRTGLSLATAHRSIQTMIARGYIDQDNNNGRYRLGMQFVRLGGIVVGRIELIRVATPYLQDLSKKTEQDVNLSIYDNGKALCLAHVESFQNFLMGIKVGQRLPIYAGALSKIILAYLQQHEIDSVLASDLASFTSKTIAQKEKLLIELETIRDRGFAQSSGELATDVFALAAPIFNYSGKAVGGISISGPEHFYTSESIGVYCQHLLDTARAISKDLGYITKKGANL